MLPGALEVKSSSPLLGFNNNVRHKGRVFHIQTEDSGVRHPHIITHLFADGGRILKTIKTSYAEHVGDGAMTETVRAMMQEQHKAMFLALRSGKYDNLFDEPASAPVARPARPAEAAVEPHDGEAPTARRRPSRPESRRAPARLAPPPAPEAKSEDATDEPTLRRRSERSPPAGHEIADLPPPPAAVFARRPTSMRPPPPRIAEALTAAPNGRDRASKSSAPPGRYAPARPASIFAAAADEAPLFGGDLLRDRSLDEVILSYLADDLEAPAEPR
jgi:hypothetical protein